MVKGSGIKGKVKIYSIEPRGTVCDASLLNEYTHVFALIGGKLYRAEQ